MSDAAHARTCSACSAPMEPGHLLTTRYEVLRPIEFVKTGPKRAFRMFRRTRGPRVQAWRCVTCGRIDLYAAPDTTAP